MLESLLEAKNIPTFLVLITILLFGNLLKSLVDMIWKLKDRRQSASESAIKKLTAAMDSNTKAIEKLELLFADLPKLKLDLRRLYRAVKIISGDDWQKIRTEIVDEGMDIL